MNVRLGLLRAAIVVVLLALAVVLSAHGATWSNILAFVVAIGAFVVLIKAQTGTRGRARLVLSFLACVAVLAGGSALVRDGWLHAVGRVTTATVSHADTYCTGRNSCFRREEYALRLPDGGSVAGDLRGYFPGTYQVGDRVTVRYDPTGLTQAPKPAADDLSWEAFGGAAVAVLGLLLLVGLTTTAARRPVPGGVPGSAVPDYRSNL